MQRDFERGDEERVSDDLVFFRVEDVAEMLGVSRSHVYQLMNQGDLPSTRFGGCRRISKSGLRQWLEAQRR
jgi:excisionase family DNA binding protein